jgi:hypothetical protein
MGITLRFGAFLIMAAVLPGAENPREIVRRSTEENRRNEKLTESYTFIERQDERGFDSRGRAQRHAVKSYDVTLTEGSPYRRLIARDDKPLPPDEERAERQKLEKSIAQRRSETPAQREKRLADWRHKREREREFLREVPDAFDFRMAGEETLGGRRVYVIDATPRGDFKPRSNDGKLLTKMKGRLWIDAETYDWAKAEAQTVDTISFGGFALRVGPGTRFTLDQVRVNGEIWLPKQVTVTYQARLLLFKKLAGQVDYTYSDYKKFQSDSRIVATEPARSP